MLAEKTTETAKKLASLQSSFESKLTSAASDLDKRITTIALQVNVLTADDRVAKSEAALASASGAGEAHVFPAAAERKPKATEKTSMELELEGKMEKLLESVTKSLNEVRSNTEGRLYEMDCRIDEAKQREDALKATIDKMPMHEGNSKDSPMLLIKPGSLREEVANELYQRYSILSKELEDYKQMVLHACASTEEGVTKSYTSFRERLELLEHSQEFIDLLAKQQKTNFDLLSGGLHTIQKSLQDKLKVKVVLPGLDSDKDNDKAPSFAKDPVGSKSANQQPSRVLAFAPPMISSGVSGNDLLAVERKLLEFSMELRKLATRESIEKVDQAVRQLQVVVTSKADRRELEQAVASVENNVKALDARIRPLEEAKEVAEKRLADHTAQIEGAAKQAEEDEKKV